MEVTKKIYNLQSLNFLKDTKLKIGVLGGSFDPAHAGHFMISKQAIDFYKFDYVIWLVANQNPLKPTYKHNIFERANVSAHSFNHPKILVSTAEHDFGTYYLYDSLKKLTMYFPSNDFTWLMGMDNITNFHKWQRYQDIVDLCKIIIFDRIGHERYVNNSKFFLKFKPFLAKIQTNHIIINKEKMHPMSSSQIKYS